MSFSGNKITENTLDNQTNVAICQGKLFDLQPIDNKRVEISFTASEISSDGGLLLVKDIESRIGIIKSLVSCIEDTPYYHSFSYKAGSWEIQQRVIVKIEVTSKGTNIRFIVTDLWEYRTKALCRCTHCRGIC